MSEASEAQEFNMKKPITQNLIKEVLSQYKRYKLSLGESHVIESISAEISDQLRRNFVIEPIPYRRKKKESSEE